MKQTLDHLKAVRNRLSKLSLEEEVNVLQQEIAKLWRCVVILTIMDVVVFIVFWMMHG